MGEEAVVTFKNVLNQALPILVANEDGTTYQRTIARRTRFTLQEWEITSIIDNLVYAKRLKRY